MGIYQRIYFYKTLLMVFWCVNVVLICVTLVASLRYFQNNRVFEASLESQRQVMQVLNYDNEFAAISALPQRNDDDTYEIRKRTDLLKKDLLATGELPPEIQSFAQSNKWKLSATEWSALRTSLLAWVKVKIQNNEDSFQSIGRTTMELIFLGIFTLIFGIVLPLMAFALLTKNLLKAKRGLEDQFTQWMAKVLEKIPDNKETPWSNPSFWMEVILASFEIFAPQSRHPIILLMKDFIPAIRKEFAKSRTNPSGPSSSF